MSDNEHYETKSYFKQTWWDKNLGMRFEEFASWVGPSGAYSKVFFRIYVKSKGYRTMIDLGCGNATEYNAYKIEYPEMDYLGVDSSEFLYKRNTELGIPMILSEAQNVPMEDNSVDVVFSRHVLEHQPSFKPVMEEMIRLARVEAIHVFFLIPGYGEIINYDVEQNLFHNVYSKTEIDDFLASHPDVAGFSWIPLSKEEEALSIIKKPSYAI